MLEAISISIDVLFEATDPVARPAKPEEHEMSEPVPTRIQLALNVDDIDAAVAFYGAMFGAEPAKRRPGYANFAIASPPLKLVLIENKGAGERLNHLGVEMGSVDDVDAAHHLLLRQAGQVLGRGRTRRRALGVLHGSRGQPHVLRRGHLARGVRHLLRGSCGRRRGRRPDSDSLLLISSCTTAGFAC